MRAGGPGYEVRDSKLGEDSPIFGIATADFAALLRRSRQDG
jgi:hypothetical protein